MRAFFLFIALFGVALVLKDSPPKVAHATDVNVTAVVIDPNATPSPTPASPTPASPTPASPSPSSPSPSLAPSSTPASSAPLVPYPSIEPSISPFSSPLPTLSPSPSTSPTPSPPPTLVETVLPVVQTTFETIGALGAATLQGTQEAVRLFAEATQPIVEQTAHVVVPTATALSVSILIGASATALQTTTTIATQLAAVSSGGGNAALDVLGKSFEVFGLYRTRKIMGFLYESTTKAPVSFAVLTITGQSSTNQTIVETLVSDVNGLYRGTRLPKGSYRLSVSHQNYSFPTKKPRPKYITVKDYYMGELFEVKDERQLQFFGIPLDPTTTAPTRSWSLKHTLGLFGRSAQNLAKMLALPLLLFALSMSHLAPSLFNHALTAFYLLLTAHGVYKFLLPQNVYGTIRTSRREPIPNAIVRLSQKGSSIYSAVLLTDARGAFGIRVKPGEYIVHVTKIGYQNMGEDTGLNGYQIDTRKGRHSIEVLLDELRTTADEVFENTSKA